MKVVTLIMQTIGQVIVLLGQLAGQVLAMAWLFVQLALAAAILLALSDVLIGTKFGVAVEAVKLLGTFGIAGNLLTAIAVAGLVVIVAMKKAK